MVVNDICCIRFELDGQSYKSVGIQWDICYKFFRDNKTNLPDVSEEACEKLFVYLNKFRMTKRNAMFKGKEASELSSLVSTIAKYPNGFELTLADYDSLNGIYLDIVSALKEIKPNQKSYVLPATKIMMGVYGCVPAFDRRLKAKFSSLDKRFKGNFTKEDFSVLNSFYEDNKTMIDIFSHLNLRIKENEKIITTEIPYPVGRLIDCYGWH